MSRLVQTGAAILALVATANAHALAPADLMRMLASVPASEVRFVETRTSALLKQPLVTEGRLAWHRPDRLEREVQKPWRETSVITGNTMALTDRNGTKRMVTIPEGAPGALVEALRATLAGNLPALERQYAITVGGTAAGWTLTLSPRDPAVGALVGRVDFAGRNASIDRIEVLEAGGDRTVTTLHALPK